MNSSATQPFGASRPPEADRAERIRQIIYALSASGDALDPVAVAGAHADLMPELGEQLNLLRRIQSAEVQAAQEKDAFDRVAYQRAAAARLAEGHTARHPTGSGLGRVSRPAGDGSADGEWELADRAEDRFLRDAISDYDLGPRLRQGGQGVVYKATQRSNGRRVAIKVLLDAPVTSRSRRRRFEREVEIASKLDHPGIVTIRDSGEALGRPWFVMDFIDGRPIDEQADLDHLSVRQRVELMIEICRAVGYAHQRGVIHRDLKPANILVARGDHEGTEGPRDPGIKGSDSSPSVPWSLSPSVPQPKVLDFGLAKELFEEDADQTQISITGQIMGTLEYLSPEQAAGRTHDVDTRSDIYSLGVMLYELLTGFFPYSVLGSRDVVCAAIQNNEAQRPGRALAGLTPPDGVAVADIQKDLESVVLKALNKAPERRYASTIEFADDLQRWLDGKAVLAHGGRKLYLLKKALLRHRGVAAVTAVALVALVGMGGWLASVTWERRAAEATRDARIDWNNDRNRQQFQSVERTAKLANRAPEMAAMDPDLIAGYYQRSVQIIDADQGMAAVVADMPEEIDRAARSGDPSVRGTAEAWLERNSPFLDTLSATLAGGSLVIPGSPPQNEDGSFPDNDWVAAHVVRAFVARAYLGLDPVDPTAALADLTAANRLALDIADGGMFSQKSTGLKCRISVYRFLLDALSDAMGAGARLDPYLHWIDVDPIVTSLTNAWEYEQIQALGGIQGWFVTDANGEAGRLDLELLQRSFRRSERTDAWIAEIQRSGAENLTREQAEREFDAYIDSARGWGDLTYHELQTQGAAFDDRIALEGARNPVLHCLGSGHHSSYAVRLRASALRRAVRLVAHAIRFRDATGSWPSRAEDAVPAHLTDDLIDPLTGIAFEYDIVADLPRIGSAWIEGLFVRADQRGPWIADGDELATYFPAPQRPR